MGKDKGKKKDAKAKNADPKVVPKVRPNQSKEMSSSSKAEYTQDIKCEYCARRDGQWYVQCDRCDLYVHFSCAGITEISEEELWLCRACEAVVNQERSTNDESNIVISEQIVATADIHNHPNPNLEGIQELSDEETETWHESRYERQIRNRDQNVTQAQLPMTSQSASVSNIQKISSTRVPSVASHSKSSKSKTVSSDSSVRRRDTELKRLEEELNLQTELDAETLALKLEGVKLKERRQKKFLEEKYKALSVGGGSNASTRSSNKEKSSFISSWIESQRIQNKVSKAKSLDDNQMRNIQRFDGEINKLYLDCDVSIPISEHEIARLRSARPTDVHKNSEQQVLLDEQVQKFLAWRNQEAGVSKDGQRTLDKPKLIQIGESDQAMHQNNQPISFSIDESRRTMEQNQNQNRPRNATGSEHIKINVSGDQVYNASQQQKVSVAHATSQFHAQPRSRSTLLNEQPTSGQNHKNRVMLDVQNADSTYVFSRNNQHTNPSVAKPSYRNQRGFSTHLQNENLVSNQPVISTRTSGSAFGKPTYSSVVNNNHVKGYGPMLSANDEIVSSMENAGNGNQYYEQIYSFHNPVSSSMQQSNGYGNQYQNFNDPVFSSRPIQQTMSYGNMNNNRPPRVRHQLTPSQIASRHALPRDLPKFTGNPKDWCRFFKRYTNSTGMCGYGDDENLERLDKCLDGKARTLVESLLLMPDSVPEIMETLYEKYGRPELVIKIILDDVRSYPFIKPDKLERLSDYGYAVKNACSQIEDLNLRNYLINPELIQEVVDKLPFQTRIDWARYSENLPEITLRHLADWLHRLARTINRITSEVNTSSTDHKKSNFDKGEKAEQPKSDNAKNGWVYFHDKNKPSESGKKQAKCSICNNDCKSAEVCPKFKGLDVDQRWISVKEKNLCRKCLNIHKNYCRISKACGVNGCEYKHHSLLHNDQRHSKGNSHSTYTNDTKKTQPNNKKPIKVSSGSNNTHYADYGELFRVVPVELHSNGRIVTTYAYLDEGSSFTLMERHIAEKLDLSGVPETICLLWTKNVHRQEESEIVDLEIAGIMRDDKIPSIRYPLRAVNVVQDLNLPEQSLPLDDFKQRYEYLRDIPMAGYDKITPTLLIGIKHAKLAVPLETVEGKEDEEGPIATRSRLGWSVYGPSNNTSTGYVNTHRVLKCPCQERDDEMHKMIKDHFTVENFGVVASSASLDSKENEKALKMMKNLTVRKGNRFETGLLWKNEIYQLPDSYGMARKRLVCMENKGPKVINVINESIKDYVQKGYAHKLTPEELAKSRSRVWYLPIFTVVNPKKPEKLRTVFDAAARVKGVSLNSMLHTGPDLVPSIVDILRRFRENEIAFNGDVKEMYHQVDVIEEDKHAQRFLWRDGELTKEPEIYVMDVLTFGSRSSPCSAQYVKNLNASEFEKDYPRATISIIKNTYVDDLMDGGKSVEEVVKLIKDAKFIHRQGGFEIRNFKSNSKEVMEAIGEKIDDRKILVDDGSNIERVLGMFWDTKSDSFTFLLKYTKVTAEVLAGKRLPTKRELLKLLMSIFDPLGLLSYYLIHVKILLQNVWRSKIGWDDVLPDNLKPMWDQWIKILSKVEKLKIPRWHFSDMSETNKEIELHIFVDASADAYTAVAYLRFETNSEGYACSLVGSKARVTPLKYMSIPRKELMASLLGTRLSNSIREGLASKIHRRVIWSDSTTVLTWLQSEHQKYSQFVAHRVGEILETSELSEWRWVPTKLNVADEATKWSKNPTFIHTDRWFTGPEFLKKPESDWPKPPRSIVPNGTTEEMKLSCSHSGLVMPSVVIPENFSKWERAVRAVAFAIRWGKKLLAKVRNLTPPIGPLTQEELSRAETLLFRQAQWQGFTEEMVTLTKNQKRPDKLTPISKASPIYDCSPYLDEFGILRLEGRTDKAIALSYDARRPIIMPRNNLLSKLLMLSYHRKFLHKNHDTAVNELIQRFYIPRIRVAYRSARWSCMLCETKRRRPRIPKMADLPAIRFETGILPFTYTGIDYFGPINVMVGRRTEKRWGVLLTCLTIRAIHIEIAPSLDTGSCIKAIRNFTNTRGRPAEFYSDNGSNFVGADNELKKELEKLNEHDLATAITSCYTKWNFNPPASPHMGGCWERLISTVKSCFKESMISRTPKEEDLRSQLLEIMNIVNARPLTYIPLESSEGEALTPNHFILGSSNGIKAPGKFTNDGPYLRESWKEIQRCTDIFWNRFIREYVPTLTRRTKWFENVKPLEVGDLVIDINEENFRNTYVRARIVETMMGSKGQVRRARIQMADGKTLWRPAARLAVLDVINKPSTTVETTEASTAEEKNPGHSSNIALGEIFGNVKSANEQGEFRSSGSFPEDRNWGENVGATNSNITLRVEQSTSVSKSKMSKSRYNLRRRK